MSKELFGVNIDPYQVVYVGPFSFPNGGAAAKRIQYISKSLITSGMKVTVLSGQVENINTTIDGIEVVSVRERTAEHLPRLLKHMSYITMGSNSIRWLDSLETKPRAVILYSGYTPYLLKLLKWCNKHKVKLIFDAVEWYDPPSKIHAIHPYYINIELAMRYLLPQCDGIIAISKYLTNYYSKKQCQVITVPPTCGLPTENLSYVYQPECVELVYAGSPGHKDRLADIISAVQNVRAEGIEIMIKIVGLDSEQFDAYSQKHKLEVRDLESIKLYGFLSMEDVIKIVSESDFSILVRPHQRYAEAGFSTKFVESLHCGTPVIANLTSDLGDYLNNGENGIVCNGYDQQSIESSLRKAAYIKRQKIAYLKMRESAKAKAKCFHYKEYNEKILSLL